MAQLRGPEGCPWDKAQDYDSVKALLLEEAYEVIDAINARDFDALEDELGDLLFQVVFFLCYIFAVFISIQYNYVVLLYRCVYEE